MSHIEIKNSKLVLHHVGGRAGSISFPIPENFGEDFINIIYEADASCIELIHHYWSQYKSQTKVYPYCLFQKAGKQKFFLNYDP